MNYRKVKKVLAAVLVAGLVAQNGAPYTLAADSSPVSAAEVNADSAEEGKEVQNSEPVLQDGTAVIPSGASQEQVKAALYEALVADKNEATNADTLEWEYFCTGKNGLLTNDAWGSVFGFTSEKKVVFVLTTFTHPALAGNEDRDYQVRLKGTDKAVTLTKKSALDSAIQVKETIQPVSLVYNEDVSVDYDAVREAVFAAAVDSTVPAGLTAADVTMEYYATTKVAGIAHSDWSRFGGENKNIYTYPAMGAGNQKIRITYGGNDTYHSTSVEVNVEIKERPAAVISVKEGSYEVSMPYNADSSVNYSELKTRLFDAVVAGTEPSGLTAADVTVEYQTKDITALKKDWVPLEGGQKGVFNYPAISEGTQNIRITYAGNWQYGGTSVEAQVNIKGRPQAEIVLNEGTIEAGIAYNDDLSIDYDKTRENIFNAAVKRTVPALTVNDVEIEYNAARAVTEIFKPLEFTDSTQILQSFGVGEFKIRISYNDTTEYKGTSVEFMANMTDGRLASSMAVNENVSVTYNMDAQAVEKAIFDAAVNWGASVLPAKDTLDLSDFTIEYYAEKVYIEGVAGPKAWVPVTGGKVNLIEYPAIGAGTQKVRVKFNGNKEYQPSEAVELTVEVNKAKVKVKVNSTNIFADESLPTDFITTNPADDFNIYTVYAGITSGVTAALYLDLPADFTDNNILSKALDKVTEAVIGKSFSEMMNDGVTLGELRKLFTSEELMKALETLGQWSDEINTLYKIMDVVNKLPSVTDGIRVGFGTPNRAGLYEVTVITSNPNYKTGVGIGALLVKMRTSGSVLAANDSVPSKLSAEQAKNTDFGYTLTYDGVPVEDQSSVHYLYSGFTSKWRVYSSTTTPPTEPGSYVQTTVILGGNYMAAPVTRSFKITK